MGRSRLDLVIEDFEGCYRAAASRDRRFDGRFVIAVRTTGVYCRPSCPAQTLRRENVRFYPVAAAAQAAGFRACKRCKPQAAPGSRDWDIRADLASRALRLIADGVVDDAGVGGLAQRMAVSERHLHRLLMAEVGASPLALARTRRAQTARLLVESTNLSITDIAFTAGYSSVRQFNDSFREAFGCTPSELRARSTRRIAASGAVALRLSLHPPYDGDSWLSWLRSRAVDGIEEVTGTTYRRTIRLPHTTGIVELTPAADHMAMRLSVESLADLAVAVSRCRVLGDLDADPETVATMLMQDPLLAPAVAKLPGLRVPGHLDGFELACRAIVGQQISVAGARTILGRLIRALGQPLSTPDGTLDRLFPTANAVAGSTLDGLGLTNARRRTLTALAGAVTTGSVVLDRGADRTETVRKLLELPGIGPWTASYIAIRALGDPDAFPASDLGLLRTSKALGGPDTGAALEQHSLRWRPWRSYAAQYLWSI